MIVGFTSTGSKRPDSLFGPEREGLPERMQRSSGCTVEAEGKSYLDFIMALGAVALGYGHPAVTQSVFDAVQRGGVGPLAPEDEAAFAAELSRAIPLLEQVLFLKTGAEAVAAAVRIARVATGRDRVVSCGYHGWLDWCGDAGGIPAATQALRLAIPFNDAERTRSLLRTAGDSIAAVVVEPVVDAVPNGDWLTVLREETAHNGTVLIFDEIKTAFRLAIGGAAERWGIAPDLMVTGKAMANGFPLAAVGGSRDVMQHATRTWISSTLATEFVAFAAARATLKVMHEQQVPRYLTTVGTRLWNGLGRLADEHPRLGLVAAGIPEMCYLRHSSEQTSRRVTVECARRGLLFKRSAYNFVSLAHDDASIDRALAVLAEVLAAC
ncbi:MAG: aminotransferase class III-fold pyridoxal phosphate-dependent enzyme [Gemmatimonadales bacterium]